MTVTRHRPLAVIDGVAAALCCPVSSAEFGVGRNAPASIRPMGHAALSAPNAARRAAASMVPVSPLFLLRAQVDDAATGKTGDERKAFMKDCLSAKPAAAPQLAP